MSENSKIREKLKRGDFQTIADATGYSKSMVLKTLDGDRNNTMILKKAAELVATRENFIKNSLNELQGN